jgi:HAE1 family hydrophobic/amphiphilic exporter-1
MSLTSISTKRPVSTIMFFLGIILLGFISLTRLNINLLPDLNYPKLTVLTEYPGLGPEEIEQYITKNLEANLSSVKGIKKVDSVSKEGVSIITLEFHWGSDMNFAFLHTKEKVEQSINSLPDDCDPPVILEMDPSDSPIVVAVMKSSIIKLKDIKETAEFIIKQRLEQLEGVSKVEVRGGDKEEISVEISPEKIKNLGITLGDVRSAIEKNNQQNMGGFVRKDDLKYILSIEAQLKTPEEIEEVSVKALEGRNIFIKDIGRAFYKNKIRQGDTRYNLDRSISLVIYREAAGNTVTATNAVEKTLTAFNSEFNDIDFKIIAKEADLIVSSINSLKFSLLLGGACAFFILLLFLQNYRDPIQVAIVIPISIISTFVLMFFFKVDINIMSLGGLVLGVGMFVDNSIIVLESIFRHRKEDNLINSVIKGTREVSGAITASTLTTISIFLPVIYLYGVTGRLFRDQALTVSFSLISSLFVSITLLPALAALKQLLKSDFIDDIRHFKKKGFWPKAGRGFYYLPMAIFGLIGYVIYYILGIIIALSIFLFKFLGKFFNMILTPIYKGFNLAFKKFDDFYHLILGKILDKKSIALIITLVTIGLIFIQLIFLDKELLPKPDSNKFEINAQTVSTLGFEETDRVTMQIEKKIKQLSGVEYIFSEAGSVSKLAAKSKDFSVNSIHLVVSCVNKVARVKLMEKSRTFLKNLQSIEEFSVFLEKNTLSRYLTSEGENFQIKVFYEEIKEGRKASKIILENLMGLTQLRDLQANTASGKPLFKITFNKSILEKMSISRNEIADIIIQSVRGEKAGELRKIQKKYDIFVRVPVDGIINSVDLMNIPLSIRGNTYYIKDLIEFKEIPSIKEICRDSQERYFMISANVKSKVFEETIKTIQKRLANIDIPVNTRFVFSGEQEERTRAFDSLKMAIILAIVLVYMVMAAQFENILQPLIIMTTVPMGLFGAFLFILLSGNSLNIISGIGIMVLIGIGVNDAIVKVEYSNQCRKEGLSVRESILKASRVRLRPILITTFTTIFGLIPMGLMSQTGSELQKPLAFVVIGGLLFTTMLTLILIPVAYEALEDIKQKFKVKWRKSKA